MNNGMTVILVLFSSTLFQFLTALIALWNIKLTGKRTSWLVISVVMILMGVRRIIPLYDALRFKYYSVSMANEIIGLVLSVLLFIGVLGIRRIFIEWKNAKDDINTLLNEKQVLLKEVHHRIKNNMTVIRSLLSLQSKTIDTPEAVAAFQDAISRVESMKILYDKLYNTENYQDVSIKEYLSQLVDEIYLVFPKKQPITIKKEIEDFTIGAKVILPLGIITNELLTNAMKYAFSDNNTGIIRILASRNNNHVTIVFEDNGVGLPNDKVTVQPDSFGLTLVDLLTKQIGGTIKLESDDGTRFIIEFDL